MAKKNAVKGKAKVEPANKSESAPARKVAPSAPDPPPPPGVAPAPPLVVAVDHPASAVHADTDIPLPVPPPRSPQSRSQYSPARQVAWADHADPRLETEVTVERWSEDEEEGMYVEDPNYQEQSSMTEDVAWEEVTEEKEETIRNDDLHTAWPSRPEQSPGGSQHHDDWREWGQDGGQARRPHDRAISNEGAGRSSGRGDWETAAGSTHLVSPAAPVQAPAPAPASASAPASAEEWRIAREQVATKGFSRASGKPPSPPPNTARTAPAATLLSHMAHNQRSTQAASLAQQRGQPSNHVPMPQPNPYGGAPSIMSRGRTVSGGTGGRGDRSMPPPTSAPRVPGPSSAAHQPPGAQPPLRSMTFPMQSGGVPSNAWMNWAAEAGKVANIPQYPSAPPPEVGAKNSHSHQPQMLSQGQADMASLYARYGHVQGQPKSVSFQTQPGQMRPGGHQRSQTIPAVHHQQDDWVWGDAIGGTGGSVHRQSVADAWPAGGASADTAAAGEWVEPTAGYDPWSAGDGSGGGAEKQRGSSRKRLSDWDPSFSTNWNKPQDNQWEDGGRGGAMDDGWNNPQPGGGGGWDTDPQASGSKLKRKSKRKSRGEHSSHRAPAMQQADSWGSTWEQTGTRNNRRGGGESSPIPEEDGEEEEDYDDEWDDLAEEEEDGWHWNSGRHDRHGHRVRRSDISYQLQFPDEDSAQPQRQQYPPAPLLDPAQVQQYMHLDTNAASQTMNMATGRALTTASFEFKLPQQGENPFITSNGEALKPAGKAMYGRKRKAKERIHWCFAPSWDERVSGLIKWIDAMGDVLAAIGLQYFLRTGQRGALITNARFHSPEPNAQPAFDWVRKEQLQPTLDQTFQESVVTYHPTKTVIVFVFLLSESGNSMACWRRKIPVPEELRARYQRDIEYILNGLEEKRQVFVDELPPKPDEPPSPPDKPRKRGFWRRLFGLK